jgi:hypothetical protein
VDTPARPPSPGAPSHPPPRGGGVARSELQSAAHVSELERLERRRCEAARARGRRRALKSGSAGRVAWGEERSRAAALASPTSSGGQPGYAPPVQSSGGLLLQDVEDDSPALPPAAAYRTVSLPARARGVANAKLQESARVAVKISPPVDSQLAEQSAPLRGGGAQPLPRVPIAPRPQRRLPKGPLAKGALTGLNAKLKCARVIQRWWRAVRLRRAKHVRPLLVAAAQRAADRASADSAIDLPPLPGAHGPDLAPSQSGSGSIAAISLPANASASLATLVTALRADSPEPITTPTMMACLPELPRAPGAIPGELLPSSPRTASPETAPRDGAGAALITQPSAAASEPEVLPRSASGSVAGAAVPSSTSTGSVSAVPSFAAAALAALTAAASSTGSANSRGHARGPSLSAAAPVALSGPAPVATSVPPDAIPLVARRASTAALRDPALPLSYRQRMLLRALVQGTRRAGLRGRAGDRAERGTQGTLCVASGGPPRASLCGGRSRAWPPCLATSRSVLTWPASLRNSAASCRTRQAACHGARARWMLD